MKRFVAALTALSLTSCVWGGKPSDLPVAQFDTPSGQVSCRANTCCWPWSEKPGDVVVCVRVDTVPISNQTNVTVFFRGKLP